MPTDARCSSTTLHNSTCNCRKAASARHSWCCIWPNTACLAACVYCPASHHAANKAVQHTQLHICKTVRLSRPVLCTAPACLDLCCVPCAVTAGLTLCPVAVHCASRPRLAVACTVPASQSCLCFAVPASPGLWCALCQPIWMLCKSLAIATRATAHLVDCVPV